MIWIWGPIVLLVLGVCVWLAIVAVRKRGGSGVREGGRTIYRRDDNQRKSPDSPPA
jgi:hypothetical protein